MGGAVQLWLPVERFDEAMLLLRRALSWDLLDVSYAVLFDSRRAAATRWDGRAIKPTPKTAVRAPTRCMHAMRALTQPCVFALLARIRAWAQGWSSASAR